MIEAMIFGIIKSEPKHLKNSSENSGFLMETFKTAKKVYIYTPDKLLTKNMRIGTPVLVIGRFIDIWHMKKDQYALTFGAHKIINMLKVSSQTNTIIGNDNKNKPSGVKDESK